MDWESLFSGLIGVLLGAGLSFFAWHLQDRTGRRREWKAKYLSEAYTDLAEAATDPRAGDGQSYEKKKQLADVINKISLFGDEKTIKIAGEIAEGIQRSQQTQEWVSYEPLFNSLRNELRSELGLEKTKAFALMIAWRKPEATEETTK